MELAPRATCIWYHILCIHPFSVYYPRYCAEAAHRNTHQNLPLELPRKFPPALPPGDALTTLSCSPLLGEWDRCGESGEHGDRGERGPLRSERVGELGGDDKSRIQDGCAASYEGACRCVPCVAATSHEGRVRADVLALVRGGGAQTEDYARSLQREIPALCA